MKTILQTKLTRAGEILHFYVDDKMSAANSAKKSIGNVYAPQKQANGIASFYPLVIPKSDKAFIFDLTIIIKHEKVTGQEQWEICVADNFVIKKTNLSKLFNYIGVTKKNAVKNLTQGIQQQLKGYAGQFNLKGKAFVEIDKEKQLVAFGYSKTS